MIQPVNNLAFKAIYQNSEARFSNRQNVARKQIIEVLQRPDKYNNTLEQKYENKGWDFYLDADKNNYVNLSMLKDISIQCSGMKQTGITYSDKMNVGSYDIFHPFVAGDIKEAKREKFFEGYGFIIAGLLAIGAMLMSGVVRSCTNPVKAQPQIENLVKHIPSSNSDTIKTLAKPIF